MAKFANLKELYIGELKDLYDAEKRIVKALPKVDSTGAQLLEETLDEEKAADKKLTDIAMSTSNRRAQRTRGRAAGTSY
jgi:ferritin-like metal-binding protein YciE